VLSHQLNSTTINNNTLFQTLTL